MVELTNVIPSLQLDIKYATTNNFTHAVLYPNPKARCYTRKAVAERLANVQSELGEQGLGLRVFDAFRPASAQRTMWALVPDERYVANPAKGSRHNRGAAVDLTLVDAQGRELLMPTPFDSFSPKAHRDCVDLPAEALRNRQLLQAVMERHGFIGLPTEWWHFDATNWQTYPLISADPPGW